MKISVIVPSYKPGDYVYELLDSIIRQTFNHSEFELVFVLNGEREPYETNIKAYLKSHFSDISYNYQYSEWGNVSNARNIGMEVAKGDYFAFIDDDDLISDNYLEVLFSKVTLDTVAIAKPLRFVNSGDYFSYRTTDKFDNALNHQQDDIFAVRTLYSFVAAKLIHRDIIGNKKYDTSFRNGQDSIFMFEITDKVRYSVLCPDCVYYCRTRQLSNYNTQTRKMKVIKGFRMFFKFLGVWINNPCAYNFKFFLSRLVASLLCVVR